MAIILCAGPMPWMIVMGGIVLRRFSEAHQAEQYLDSGEAERDWQRSLLLLHATVV